MLVNLMESARVTKGCESLKSIILYIYIYTLNIKKNIYIILKMIVEDWRAIGAILRNHRLFNVKIDWLKQHPPRTPVP